MDLKFYRISTVSLVSSPLYVLESDKGWFRIAFAFLKPIGKNNFSNANKKVRLQLYYPGHMSTTKHNINKCYVWDWWHKQKLKKYPSTLYVTVRKIISPKKIIQAFRSKTPLQHEHISSEIVDDNKNKVVEKEPNHRTITISDTKYKVPNKCTAELDSYDEGCFLLKFSNSGEYLACVVKIDDEFSILIYETKYFQEFTKFTSHQGLIYSLNWSHNDSLLLSASADNTVAVWNFDKKNCFQILPHPTFVYASDINMENTIATGCYDKMIRIWSQTCKSRNFKLSQELGSHEGYVTSICFSRKITDTLFSADSVGKIIQWNMVEGEWKHYRNINILELNGIIINQILLFPNEKRMLVHARDSSLRIISINNCYVLHWLHGALNTRVQTYCSLSNNGHYVFCGSENGFVVVWNAKTGKDIHTYSIYQTTVHCVQLHPKENMFAVSHYGSKLPILVYSYCNSDNSIEKPVEDENALQITRNITTKFRKTYGNERNLDFHEILEKMDKMLHL